MEGNNWADFGSATANSQVGDDDDDDWADFGGFESATPAVNGSNQSGSLITWAAIGVPPPSTTSNTSFSQSTAPMMASANSASSFDPQLSTHSAMAAQTSKTSNPPISKPEDHSAFISSFLSSHEDFLSPPTVTSEQFVDTTETSSEKTEYDSFHADFSSFLSEALNEPPQLLPDSSPSGYTVKDSSSVNSSSKAPELADSQGEKCQPNAEQSTSEHADLSEPIIKALQQQEHENSPDTSDSLDKEVSSAQDILSVIMAQQQPSSVFDKPTDSSHNEMSQQLQDVTDAKEKLEEKAKGLKGKLSIAEQEKQQMQKDLNALLDKNKTLEEESRNLKETIAMQEEKYEKIQEQHQEQIKEIRQAGHDALAVIIEEYKELSRKTVLEQQEINKVQMEEVLEDQQKKFQKFLQDQQEHFETMLQEERKNNEKQAMELLEEEKQRHKAEIESYVEQEKLKSKEALEKAVEDARLQGLEAVEMARKEERQKYEEFIIEHKETMKTLTAQERERLQVLLEEAVHEEKENSREALETALKEERKRGREFAQEVKEEATKEMLEYSRVKQKADRAVRQKHLLGLDLFLESARTQLKALMEDHSEKDSHHTNGL